MGIRSEVRGPTADDVKTALGAARPDRIVGRRGRSDPHPALGAQLGLLDEGTESRRGPRQ
jgi:hypothetical protein